MAQVDCAGLQTRLWRTVLSSSVLSSLHQMWVRINCSLWNDDDGLIAFLCVCVCAHRPFVYGPSHAALTAPQTVCVRRRCGRPWTDPGRVQLDTEAAAGLEVWTSSFNRTHTHTHTSLNYNLLSYYCKHTHTESHTKTGALTFQDHDALFPTGINTDRRLGFITTGHWSRIKEGRKRSEEQKKREIKEGPERLETSLIQTPVLRGRKNRTQN